MAMFPTLRKSLRPAASSSRLFTPEAKSAAGRYIGDLRAQLSAQTGREWTVDRAVAEAYERLVWVFKPVNVIAENQAARKFVLRQGTGTLDDHPLAKLLNVKANPWETGKVLRKRLSAQILLSPVGAFAEFGMTNGGDPYRIDLLPPGRVRIVASSGRDAAGNPADPRDVRSLVDHYALLDSSGRVERGIDVDKVRWFRDPHPLDPFRGITPLEAAGLSVELDHFARLYNVTFLKNDGRPGGIVAVKGDLEEAEMAAIERKFDKGPAAAGKFTVLSADGLDFLDPAGKPRDMSYMQLARNAKIELLSSFGVSESMMGYSGEKTFANAEQERLGFWQDTMPPHLSIIADGFNEDTDDDIEPGFDLSDIEVLERLKDARLARAREEVAAGLLSPFDYAQLSGNDSVEDTIHTRSLYIASGKQPLPINQADAEAMGLGEAKPGDDTAGGAGAAVGEGEPVDQGTGVADAAAGAAAAAGGGSPEGAVPSGPGAAQAALAAAGTANPATPTGGAAAAALAALAPPQTKGRVAVIGGRPAGVRLQPPPAPVPPPAVVTPAAPVLPVQPRSLLLRVVGGKAADAWMSDDADEAARDQLEQAVASVLTELAAGWCERAAARMSSVKSRKHTRHWQPEGDRPVDLRVATKAIDPTYAVDEQAWAQEAEEQTSPLLIAAALAAAYATWQGLGGIGQLPSVLAARATAGALEVAGFIGASARRMAGRLARAINDADQQGLGMAEMIEGVLSYRGRLVTWADAMGLQGATGTVEGARAAAAAAVADTGIEVTTGGGDPVRPLPRLNPTDPDPAPVAVQAEVVQRWRTRRDDRVRDTHRRADGQSQPAGGLFEVGGYLLRWPGDPLAPASETRNCRCTVNYRSRRTGRFVPRPTPLMEAAQ